MNYESEVRRLRPKGADWDKMVAMTMDVANLNRDDAEFILGLLKDGDNELITNQFKQMLMSIKMVYADAFEQRSAEKRDQQRKYELEQKKREAEEKRRIIDLDMRHKRNLDILKQNKLKFDQMIDYEIELWREPKNYNENIDKMDLINSIVYHSDGSLEMVRCGFLWTNILLTGNLSDTGRSKIREYLQKKGYGNNLIPIPEDLFIPRNHSDDMMFYLMSHSSRMKILGEKAEPRYFKEKPEF